MIRKKEIHVEKTIMLHVHISLSNVNTSIPLIDIYIHTHIDITLIRLCHKEVPPHPQKKSSQKFPKCFVSNKLHNDLQHIPTVADVLKNNSTVTCGRYLILLMSSKTTPQGPADIPKAADVIKNNSTVTCGTYLMLLMSSKTTPQWPAIHT